MFQTTALIEAVWKNRQDAVNLLLDHKADSSLATSDGMTPLTMAAQEGWSRILDTLLQPATVIVAVSLKGNSPVHHACFNGKPDCAEFLAKHGCDMTLRIKDGNTGLQIAQKKGHRAVVAMLLRRIVAEKMEANGKQHVKSDVKLTPEALNFEAADKGDDGGANVNHMIDTKDTNGKAIQTPALMQAVYKNKQEAVNLLLDRRADPNLASSDGQTPLMAAAQEGYSRILDTLLQP